MQRNQALIDGVLERLVSALCAMNDSAAVLHDCTEGVCALLSLSTYSTQPHTSPLRWAAAATAASTLEVLSISYVCKKKYMHALCVCVCVCASIFLGGVILLGKSVLLQSDGYARERHTYLVFSLMFDHDLDVLFSSFFFFSSSDQSVSLSLSLSYRQCS